MGAFFHRMGADNKETFLAKQVDPENRSQVVTDAYDIEGWTGFDFPGREDKYSKMKWNFNHFSGVDWDDKAGEKKIFLIEGKGKTFSDKVDQEKGGYDFLMGSDIE